RGVNEKNGVAPSAKEKNEAIKDGVAPSVTIVFGINNDTQDENSGQCPSTGLTASVSNGAGVVVPLESIRVISEQYANSAYGFFLGKRMAYPIVANYVRNTWGKYGLVKSLLNSSTGLFFFQFSSMDGLYSMLENGLWSSYASTLIEIRANAELKDTIVVAMPKLIGEGFCTCTIRVEYEWKPPRGVLVGPKVGFKPTKQFFRPASKKTNANTGGNKKKDVETTKELEKLIIEGKVTLVDDDGKPLKINGFGTKSLLEQWTDSYENGDYDEDPYDDDIYEGHDLSDKLQDICDNLDIRVIAGDAKPSRQTLTPSSDSLKIFFFLSWKTKSTLPSSSNVVSKKADDVVIMIRIKKWKRGNKSLYEQWKENHGEDLYDDDDFDV
ncbi:hypothetical protein Tco_0979152, partial [Tanacetum coccineum]